MSQPSIIHRREVTIPGDLAALATARTFIESSARECGFNQNDVFQIALAVDEACSNLIRHAYKELAGSSITLRTEQIQTGVVISIFDEAGAFDPLQVQSPDMQEYLASFKRGGLGVHLMRRIMDKIEYFPSDAQQHTNELRLTKLFS